MIEIEKERGKYLLCYPLFTFRSLPQKGSLTVLLLNLIRVLLLVVACIRFSVPAIAQGQVDYARIAKSYVEASFPKDYGQLRKFSDVSHLSYELECYSYSSEKCDSVNDYIRFSLFSVENMKLEKAEHGQLQIIFADENKLFDQALKLTQEFSGGRFDVEDTECQLYLKLSESNITKAAIIISLDAQPQKIVNCLLVDFYQSLGLSLKGGRSFTYAWSGGAEPLNKLNIAAFPKLRKYVSVLEYIHACPKLIAGMSKSQVENELISNSVCLKNLNGIEDGR